MKSWKWRIILSAADTFLSLGLSPQFYHGVLAHSVAFYLLIRSLNLVPAAFAEVTGIWRAYHVILGSLGSWTFYVFWNSQFLNFLFWWWVGWKIDLKVASRECERGWMLADVILGFTLSWMVFFSFRAHEPLAIRAATIGWGVALFCYSVVLLPRLKQMFTSSVNALAR